MTQEERRRYLIECLMEVEPSGTQWTIPADAGQQRRLLRAMMNVRRPLPVSEAFLIVQDEYLQEEIARKGITDAKDLLRLEPGIALWQGDITTLRCDAIVNAANSGMLGCFCPNHGCIDNAIHTFAGVQLRLACAQLMRTQGYEEPTGTAKLTPAFNLPSRYVLHTVGPVVRGALTREHEAQLASCYRACLSLAQTNGLFSVAFCCISTGEFHFPNERAAQIAVRTVRDFLAQSSMPMEVIFNVFQNIDYAIYQSLLGQAHTAESSHP